MCLLSMLENMESSEAFEGNGTLNTENLFRVQGSGFRVLGAQRVGFAVYGFGVRDLG